MTAGDRGGDPACWAHLFEEDEQAEGPGVVIVDLGGLSTGADGAVWSLPHGGDLDANLVRLNPGASIGEHRNDDVDVLILVRSGSGELRINRVVHRLGADHLALVPEGAARSITAGTGGLTYLSIHRRRGPLTIAPTVAPKSSTTEQPL